MNFEFTIPKAQIQLPLSPWMLICLGATVQGNLVRLFWCLFTGYIITSNKYMHLSILLRKPPFTLYYHLLKPTAGLIEVCRLHYTYLQIKHLHLVLKLLQKLSLLLRASFSYYEFHTIYCFCVSLKILFIGGTKVKLD